MSRQDATDLVATTLAALSVALIVLVALLALLALAALVVPGARRLLADVRDAVGPGALWAAWIIALTATLGSLFFSEISDFIPCRLCWYQRIAMYPLAVILLVAAVRRDVRGAFLYGIAFPVVGALVAIYHLYIEANPDAESASCKIGAPCSTKWIDEFGFVTIPVLAIAAFAAITALLLLARSARRAAERVAEPDADETAGDEPGALPAT